MNQHKAMMFLACQAWRLLALSGQCNQQGVSCGGLMISIWSLWKPWHIKADPMVWLLDIWSYLDLIFGVAGFLFHPFNLLLFYKADAVSCNCCSVEAKPAALQQTMEAMGVRGLTIQKIKSHLQVPLPVSDHSMDTYIIDIQPCMISIHFPSCYFCFCQRYREKCILGAEAHDDIPHTTSSSKGAPNLCDSSFK